MSDERFSEEAIRRRMAAIPSEQTLGFRLEELSYGRAVIVAPYDPKYDGIFHCFHGGLLAALADSTGGTATLTVSGAETTNPTTDLSIRFLAPCRTDARATAQVIHAGGTLLTAEINIHDMNGQHIAVAQATYIRLKKKC